MPAARRTWSPASTSQSDYLIIVEFFKLFPLSQNSKSSSRLHAFLLWNKLQLIKLRYDFLLLPREPHFVIISLVIYCWRTSERTRFSSSFWHTIAHFSTIHIAHARVKLKRRANFLCQVYAQNNVVILFRYPAKVKWSVKHKAALCKDAKLTFIWRICVLA